MNNQWTTRFDSLLDKDEIKRRATVTVTSLLNLHRLDKEEARTKLEKALELLYVPDQQAISLLSEWVLRARAHSQHFYQDAKQFLRWVYAEEVPLPKIAYPVCLTGLAGVGKSELLKAFFRILPEILPLTIDDRHKGFKLCHAWSVSINTMTSFVEALSTASGIYDKGNGILEACRMRAYRDGVSFLGADEFQFASQSANANALVTKMLLALASVGVPFVYGANYSLLHRLLKRPQEDQDRLLSNVVVLNPMIDIDQDWIDLVSAQKAIAPDVFKFGEQGTVTLHRHSLGIKRASARLLVAAYMISRETDGMVSDDLIDKAFLHPLYASFRRNIEAILQQRRLGKALKGRNDLWCPIGEPLPIAAKVQEQAIEQRKQDVAEAKVFSSMTADERAQVSLPRLEQKQPAREKASPVTADRLREDTSWMFEQVLKTPVPA